MRFALAMIALFAIVGTALAIDSVEIRSPVEDQKFKLGDQISVRVKYVDEDGNSNYRSSLSVNGAKSPSRFTPAEPGFYTILVDVVDYYDGTARSDSVTIEVVDPAI
jgi:hypothetical protein